MNDFRSHRIDGGIVLLLLPMLLLLLLLLRFAVFFLRFDLISFVAVVCFVVWVDFLPRNEFNHDLAPRTYRRPTRTTGYL